VCKGGGLGVWLENGPWGNVNAKGKEWGREKERLEWGIFATQTHSGCTPNGVFCFCIVLLLNSQEVE